MTFCFSDESMHYLYNTPLLKYMEDWLDSYDIDLLTTGVLALGNFARTDSHCIEMVERNITTKLLGMLTTYVIQMKILNCFCFSYSHSNIIQKQWDR